MFPECKNTRHYAYALPYLDSNLGYTQAPANAAYVYPNAVGLVNVATEPNISASYNALLQSVRSGNILLFAGWYRHPANDVVMQIYAAAGH
jgi:hypothetical protein